MIPKIIHQIWEGRKNPLPEFYSQLTETWKKNHTDWKYEFWDNDKMIWFVKKYYPQHWDIYNRYTYNVQRWDAIRYLILNRIGGMYVDLDYECLESMDVLLKRKNCCFASEPKSHCNIFHRRVMFNNALMASVPNHPFMIKIIEKVFFVLK